MKKLTSIVMGLVAAGMIGGVPGCAKKSGADKAKKISIEIDRPEGCTKIQNSGMSSYGRHKRRSVPYISCEETDGSHKIYELTWFKTDGDWDSRWTEKYHIR